MGIKNQSLSTVFDKTIIYDFFPVPDSQNTVIFIPGFKGFKDWGPWDLVAKEFVTHGFNFIKANLSHNGVVISRDPYEITDLAAFSNNNFSIELNDLSRLVDKARKLTGEGGRTFLIGHSRGGALSILAASYDPQIDAVISWASPSNFGNHFFKHIAKWAEEGVYYIKNNRNGRDLPIRYQLYQDYILNYDRLHIPTRVKNMSQPFLAIHGDQDETVSMTALEVFKKYCPHVESHIIVGANHTFGASHPWKVPELPDYLKEVVKISLNFIKKRSKN